MNPPPFSLSWNKTVIYKDSLRLFSGSYIETYHFNQYFWSEVIPNNLSYPEVPIVVNDTLYTLEYTSSYNSLTLSRWNATDLVWDSICPYPDTINKTHIRAIELDGNAYFMMGANGDFDAGKKVWRYEISSSTWTEMSDLPGQGRRYYAIFKIENIAYIATGTNGTNLNNLWAFIPPDTTKILTQETDTADFNLPLINTPYPNPSTDKIYIKIYNPDGLSFQIRIYNLRGQLVNSSNTVSDQIIINSTGLSTGSYYYVISSENLQITKGKIIFI